MRTIVVVTVLGVLGPAGLALAHELPGQGCEHAAEGKNKHCGEHEHPDGGPNGDPDGDGFASRDDNCDDAFNPAQGDYDGDDIGNVCDHFLDDPSNGDGMCDLPAEACGAPDTSDDPDDDDGYAVDTDGDGFDDADEDPMAVPPAEGS